MSVRLRMRRMGTKKRPFWRIVAIDTRNARDGRFIDIVGHYNPMVDPAEIAFDEDKVYHWLDKGALPSEKVERLLRKLGLMERWRLLKGGVKIQELDAAIAERRLKQPKRAEGKEKKQRPGKKKAAKLAAAKAAEEKPPSEASKEGGAGATA